MTPVDAPTHASRARRRARSRRRRTPRARRRSTLAGPASAFALPLLATIARMPSAGSRAAASITGPARAAFTREAAGGRARDVAEDEREVLARRLDAAVDACVRKSSRGLHGGIPRYGETRCNPSRPVVSSQPFIRFRFCTRLSGGALEQVVDGAHGDDDVVVRRGSDVARVRAHHALERHLVGRHRAHERRAARRRRPGTRRRAPRVAPGSGRP